MTKDERIAQLEEEVRQLRELLCPAAQYIVHLSPAQASVLSSLHAARGKPRHPEQLAALIGSEGDAVNVVKQHVHRLRKILAPWKIEIGFARSGGYRITRGLEMLNAMRV